MGKSRRQYSKPPVVNKTSTTTGGPAGGPAGGTPTTNTTTAPTATILNLGPRQQAIYQNAKKTEDTVITGDAGTRAEYPMMKDDSVLQDVKKSPYINDSVANAITGILGGLGGGKTGVGAALAEQFGKRLGSIQEGIGNLPLMLKTGQINPDEINKFMKGNTSGLASILSRTPQTPQLVQYNKSNQTTKKEDLSWGSLSGQAAAASGHNPLTQKKQIYLKNMSGNQLFGNYSGQNFYSDDANPDKVSGNWGSDATWTNPNDPTKGYIFQAGKVYSIDGNKKTEVALNSNEWNTLNSDVTNWAQSNVFPTYTSNTNANWAGTKTELETLGNVFFGGRSTASHDAPKDNPWNDLYTDENARKYFTRDYVTVGSSGVPIGYSTPGERFKQHIWDNNAAIRGGATDYNAQIVEDWLKTSEGHKWVRQNLRKQ